MPADEIDPDERNRINPKPRARSGLLRPQCDACNDPHLREDETPKLSTTGIRSHTTPAPSMPRFWNVCSANALLRPAACDEGVCRSTPLAGSLTTAGEPLGRPVTDPTRTTVRHGPQRMTRPAAEVVAVVPQPQEIEQLAACIGKRTNTSVGDLHPQNSCAPTLTDDVEGQPPVWSTTPP